MSRLHRPAGSPQSSPAPVRTAAEQPAQARGARRGAASATSAVDASHTLDLLTEEEPQAPVAGGAALAAKLSAPIAAVGAATDPHEAAADALARRVLAQAPVEATEAAAPVQKEEPAAALVQGFQEVAGVDVAEVPVHTDAEKEGEQLGAHAFAVDEEVHVPKDASPELVAHELAHVALGHAAPGEPVRREARAANDPGIGLSGTLRQGDRGGQVVTLQDILVRLGHLSAADRATGPGIFGPKTHAAVMSFQRSAGLTVDGVVGSQTIAALSRRLTAPAPAPAAPGAGASSVTGSPALRRGDRGPLVSALQTLLNARGSRLTVDGDFGPATQSAVMGFQRAQGLVVDGVVGPRTAAKLNAAPAAAPAPAPGPAPAAPATLTGNPPLRQGMDGPLVTELQRLLNSYGADLQLDGEFGPSTDRTVRSFQRANQLGADGVVGPITAAKLTGGRANRIPAAAPPTSTNPAPAGPIDADIADGDPSGKLNGSNISPTVRALAHDTIGRMQAQGYQPYVVSTFRSFNEQDALYAKGRTAPGDIVTYVRGGGSWHNYGLAVDFAFWNSSHTAPSWDNSNPWNKLGAAGKAAGFSRWMGDSGWDFGHFEHHPKWGNSCTNLADTYRSQGLAAVWAKVM
jgi:peptidoglycan hydrolase-like protein with peptidoglycan-binding domain